MQDEQNTQAPTDGQSCGCACEFCTAGNHDQCQSGMCSVKQQQTPESDKPEQ